MQSQDWNLNKTKCEAENAEPNILVAMLWKERENEY